MPMQMPLRAFSVGPFDRCTFWKTGRSSIRFYETPEDYSGVC